MGQACGLEMMSTIMSLWSAPSGASPGYALGCAGTRRHHPPGASSMNGSKPFLIGIVLTFISLSAFAEDAVTVRYLDGYPPPDRSTEWINLRVSRPSPPPVVTKTSKQDVDVFFEQVSAVLTKNGINKNWQLAIPDAPAIEITIDMQGKKLKLVSCHMSLERQGKYLVTEHGWQPVSPKERDALLARQSEAFRQHRIAFESILRLTLTRAGARLSP